MSKSWPIMLLVLTASASASELQVSPTVVIHNSGNTIPVTSLLTDDQLSHYRLASSQRVSPDDVQNAITELTTRYRPSTESKDILRKLFPIRSEQLKPLKLVSRKQANDIQFLKSPIFVIGADRYSLDWLRVNKAELLRFGAVGVVAEAPTMDSFLNMQAMSSPLELLPTGADALAEELKVPAYPILITSSGFYQ